MWAMGNWAYLNKALFLFRNSRLCSLWITRNLYLSWFNDNKINFRLRFGNPLGLFIRKSTRKRLLYLRIFTSGLDLTCQRKVRSYSPKTTHHQNHSRDIYSLFFKTPRHKVSFWLKSHFFCKTLSIKIFFFTIYRWTSMSYHRKFWQKHHNKIFIQYSISSYD